MHKHIFSNVVSRHISACHFIRYLRNIGKSMALQLVTSTSPLCGWIKLFPTELLPRVRKELQTHASYIFGTLWLFLLH